MFKKIIKFGLVSTLALGLVGCSNMTKEECEKAGLDQMMKMTKYNQGVIAGKQPDPFFFIKRMEELEELEAKCKDFE